jgi:transcription-repair coupling factor (superfamily II helicase)
VGDPVVHAQHGIGRYRGLINMDLGQGNTEFLHLEYADKATLYVPVSQLHQISRYTGVERRRGAAAQAGLRPVGKGQAQGRRTGARHRRRTAEHLCAPRRARGPCLPLLAADYEVFANDFGFEETPTRTPRSTP